MQTWTVNLKKAHNSTGSQWTWTKIQPAFDNKLAAEEYLAEQLKVRGVMAGVVQAS